MNPVIRGVIVYVFLLLIFRLMGKRTLSQATTFDLILLLIISEVTQQGLVGEDFSITTAAILICTLVGMNTLLTLFKQSSKPFDRMMEGTPLIIINKGTILPKRMKQSQIDEDDLMQAARSTCGLERMEQIKYAVLEKDGSISIIPFEDK